MMIRLIPCTLTLSFLMLPACDPASEPLVADGGVEENALDVYTERAMASPLTVRMQSEGCAIDPDAAQIVTAQEGSSVVHLSATCEGRSAFMIATFSTVDGSERSVAFIPSRTGPGQLRIWDDSDGESRRDLFDTEFVAQDQGDYLGTHPGVRDAVQDFAVAPAQGPICEAGCDATHFACVIACQVFTDPGNVACQLACDKVRDICKAGCIFPW